jgi:hypothetical protein
MSLTSEPEPRAGQRGGAGATPIGGEARPLPVLRAAIDQVDAQIVALLNQRASLVVEVGRRKIGVMYFCVFTVVCCVLCVYAQCLLSFVGSV